MLNFPITVIHFPVFAETVGAAGRPLQSAGFRQPPHRLVCNKCEKKLERYAKYSNYRNPFPRFLMMLLLRAARAGSFLARAGSFFGSSKSAKKDNNFQIDSFFIGIFNTLK